MATGIRPLWKLLLDLETDDPYASSLSCVDCLSILEYLAEIDPAEADWPALIRKARHHMVTCPDCQTYYQARLDELESLISAQASDPLPSEDD